MDGARGIASNRGMAVIPITRAIEEEAPTLVDHLYFGWFLVMSAVAVACHGRVPSATELVGVNAIVLVAIFGLMLLAPMYRWAAFLHDWYPLAVFIVCFEEVARLSLAIVPRWQDGYLLAIEQRVFSTPPTVWMGEHGNWVVTELLELGYFSYFLLLMIVGGVLYGRPGKREFRQVMTASVISYLACYVVFLVFPTEGPHHTLAAQHTAAITGGPFHWLVGLIQTHAGVHGNAFPSSHVAAGLVSLIFAWKYAPRLARWLTPLVVLLCAGAVYDRYHYVSDVIAGLVVGGAAAWAVMRKSRVASRES